jgi:hypothetical protein
MSSIPAVIRSQIELGVLMSLGASDLMSDRVHAAKDEPSDSLTFKARILTKPRGAVRIMRVTVTLDPSDTYSIKVGYFKARRNAPGAHGWAPSEWIEHYSAENVYCDSLNRVLLSLDQVI